MGTNKRSPNRSVMSRRRFCQGAALGLGGIALPGYLAGRNLLSAPARPDGRTSPLPPPIVTGRSTEICLNSRVSRHSGLNGSATEQQIANVLWAAGRAPVTGSYRTIWLKTPAGTYIYHPEDHSLEYSGSGTVANAFRINYDRERDFDMGVSYMLALLASVSLWTGTAGQVASCPQNTDLNFGINSVPGLTAQLVVTSSNGSLPDPATDGPDKLELVLADVRLRSRLRADVDLTPQRVSQLLWAGYGCSAHMTSNGRAGLTPPSWIASYFLTNHIYVVDARVTRYGNRVGSNLATRDHRLDLVHQGDVRAALRQALPGLPAAPCYFLLCLPQSGLGVWYQRLEVGMVAGGLLAQAGALGLGCAFHAALSPAEQAAVQQITQIPATEFAHAVVACGHRVGDLDADGDFDGADLDALGTCMAGPDISAGPGCTPSDVEADGDVDLRDFSEMQSG